MAYDAVQLYDLHSNQGLFIMRAPLWVVAEFCKWRKEGVERVQRAGEDAVLMHDNKTGVSWQVRMAHCTLAPTV